MALRQRQIDPDNSPNTDYFALQDAVLGEAGDQLGDALVWLCMSSAGSVDSTPVNISAISNYASFEINGDRSAKGWDPAAYGIVASVGYGALLKCEIANVWINYMQINNTAVASQNPTGILITGNDCTINQSLVNMSNFSSAPTSFNHAVRVSGNISSAVINSVIHGNFYYGIRGDWTTTAITRTYINNTIVGTVNALWGLYITHSTAATASIINNVVQNCGTDYGTVNSYTAANISSDASSPDGVSWQNISLLFEDAANGNYCLSSADTAAIDTGADVTSYGISVDVINTPRPLGSAFDVGAFEYVTAGITITINDYLSASDSVSQSSVLSVADNAAANDALPGATAGAAISISDTANGLDSQLVIAVNIAITEAGSGTDLVNVLTEILKVIADAAYTTDAITAASSLTVSDASIVLDVSAISAQMLFTDAAHAIDGVALIKEILKAVSDSAVASDALSISAALPVVDGVVANTVAGVAVALSIADAGAGSDAVFLSALTSISDAVSADDTVSMSVNISIADAASGADAIAQIGAWVSIIESAGATDVAVQYDSVSRVAQITFKLVGRSISMSMSAGRSIKFNLH